MLSQPDRQKLKAALKVRYVARAIGADLADRHYSLPDVMLATHTGLAANWRDGRIRWSPLYIKGETRYSNSELVITTSPDRSVADIVRDLQRRIIPQAREWCAREHAANAARKEKEVMKQARLAELAAVVGKFHQRDGVHRADGVAISEYSLGGESARGFECTVHVRSWHCLLMIARLVAEDGRASRSKEAADE